MTTRLFSLLLLLAPICGFSQLNTENDRIAELYLIIQEETLIQGKEVSIYDFKVKGKKVLTDSSLMARISVEYPLSNNTMHYDTTDQTVIEFNHADPESRVPIKRYVHNEDWTLISSEIINEDYETLSKVLYHYDKALLMSEEMLTGFAYLNEPRKLSVINYEYDNNRLVKKSKKYSLNGTHWFQTWTTFYDELGQIITLEESIENKRLIDSYEYENNRLVKITTNDGDKTLRRKTITYFKNGLPKALTVYAGKKDKIIRYTQYKYD